jgi:peptidase E
MDTQKWNNVLLTDSGWHHSFDRFDETTVKENILRQFHTMLGMSPYEAKVLFIPTAANNEGARSAAGACFAELLNAGIAPKNIHIYDLDGSLSLAEAMTYDVVYFTGGDTKYLLRRIYDVGFHHIVKAMVSANKLYVGVSAGSAIATSALVDEGLEGLGLIHASMTFHHGDGTLGGQICRCPTFP